MVLGVLSGNRCPGPRGAHPPAGSAALLALVLVLRNESSPLVLEPRF